MDATAEQAVQTAKQADVVVAFVGLSPDLEGEEMPVHVDGFEAATARTSSCPRCRQQLLEAVAATGKPLVVVLMNGSALAVNWAKEHAAAILEAWYPGEEGGDGDCRDARRREQSGGTAAGDVLRSHRSAAAV